MVSCQTLRMVGEKMRPTRVLPSDTIVVRPRFTQGHHPHHHWEVGGVAISASVWSSARAINIISGVLGHCVSPSVGRRDLPDPLGARAGVACAVSVCYESCALPPYVSNFRGLACYLELCMVFMWRVCFPVRYLGDVKICAVGQVSRPPASAIAPGTGVLSQAEINMGPAM